jgi:hypothetical protein
MRVFVDLFPSSVKVILKSGDGFRDQAPSATLPSGAHRPTGISDSFA